MIDPLTRAARRAAPKPKKRMMLFTCLLLLCSTMVYVEMALRFSQ